MNITAAQRIDLRMIALIGFQVLANFTLTPSSANALEDVQTCDWAAQQAAKATGVPLDVLRAVTRTETGRTVRGAFSPWPWTINAAGNGSWFSTKDEAVRFAVEHRNTGKKNFDVGCFQINYRWHRDQFTSIDDMFDPEKNAIYAAQYLTRLLEESDGWSEAVGKFHSRTTEYSTRYLKRYERILSDLGPVMHQSDTLPPRTRAAASNPRHYPLFVASDAKPSRGSLFHGKSTARAAAIPFLILSQ